MASASVSLAWFGNDISALSWPVMVSCCWSHDSIPLLYFASCSDRPAGEFGTCENADLKYLAKRTFKRGPRVDTPARRRPTAGNPKSTPLIWTRSMDSTIKPQPSFMLDPTPQHPRLRAKRSARPSAHSQVLHVVPCPHPSSISSKVFQCVIDRVP